MTCGTVPTSFIAQKFLEVVAEKMATLHPSAASVIKSNFYMDDLLCSAPTVEEACDLRRTIHEALRKAHFRLCKYVSNSKEVLSSIETNDLENGAVELLPETEVHVLGFMMGSSTGCILSKA